MSLKRTAFWCASGLAALLVVAVSAVALLNHRPDLVLPWVRWALTPRGGSASLTNLRISLNPPSLAISGLSIAWPPPEGDLLHLDHLQVELIPGRFFHGGSWLRNVEARGLVFERLHPRDTKGPPDLTPLNRLFDIEELSLTDSRLRIAFPQGDLSADRLRIRLAPGEGGIRRFNGSTELAFRRNGATIADGSLSVQGKMTPGPLLEADLILANARLNLPWLAGDVSGQTVLKMTRTDLLAEYFTLVLPRSRLNLGPRAPKSLGPIRLSATGSATLEGKDPRLEVHTLDIGGLFLARGKLGGPTLGELIGTAEGEIPEVERVKPLLYSVLPGTLMGIDLIGRLPFRLSLSVRGKERVLDVDLLPRDLAFSWQDGKLGCRFGGSLRLSGRLPEGLDGKATLAGRLQGTGRIKRPPLAVRRFDFDVPLAGQLAAPALPGWKLSVGTGDLLYEGRPLPVGTLELRGFARASDNSFRVENVEVISETVGRVTGELVFREGSVGGRLVGKQLPVDNLIPLARALSGNEGTRWPSTGTADVAINFEPASVGPRATATVVLDRLGFSSPAGDVIGQKLALRLDFEALLTPQPRIKADMAMRQGEALWGTVYLDFAKDPLELHIEGTRVGPGEYEDLLLVSGLAGYGSLNIAGKARQEGGSWRHQGRLVLRDARLGPIFRTFLRDPLSASHPGLDKVELNGTAGVDLSFNGSGKAADLDGTLRMRSGEVRRGAEPPWIEGLDIDLPIAYSLGAANPGRPRPSESAKWGRLRLKKFLLDGETLGPLEVPAVLVPNHLYLGGAVDLSLFGAKVSLKRMQVNEPLSPGFRIKMAAQLDGLDLARLSGKEPLLEGHLGGMLDPVIIDRERGTADGTLTGGLFGGRLDIRHVMVDRPFTPGREIGADINVALLDLERFSAALGVGRITGRLSGTMEGLRIAYAQPVAFHLKMESVPEKGVSQSVSLKAVNSISLVGTGSALSGLGVSLMTTFFREFSYDKIGFECRLKNDVFTIRGLIHEGGVEYLVKRRFFAGIDVINANPDNRIGFSDMLERAKRVTSEQPN